MHEQNTSHQQDDQPLDAGHHVHHQVDAATDADAQTAAASSASPLRLKGTGAMSQRANCMDDDGPAPPCEAVDRAADAALTSGHRFDLMRYLRLRRRR